MTIIHSLPRSFPPHHMFPGAAMLGYSTELTLFDMGFFESSVGGGGGGRGMRAPHHNFVVIPPMIMKFGTDVKLHVFYTIVTKICDVTTITSL